MLNEDNKWILIEGLNKMLAKLERDLPVIEEVFMQLVNGFDPLNEECVLEYSEWGRKVEMCKLSIWFLEKSIKELKMETTKTKYV